MEPIEPAEPVEPKFNGACGQHKWCCDDVEHPILIEENFTDPDAIPSVKLGPKVFLDIEV